MLPEDGAFGGLWHTLRAFAGKWLACVHLRLNRGKIGVKDPDGVILDLALVQVGARRVGLLLAFILYERYLLAVDELDLEDISIVRK